VKHNMKRGENYPLLRKCIAADFSERAQGNIEAETGFRFAVLAGLRERHRIDEALVAIAESESVAHQFAFLDIVGGGTEDPPVFVEPQGGSARDFLAVGVETIS